MRGETFFKTHFASAERTKTGQLPPRAENSILAAPESRIFLKEEAAVMKAYKEEMKKNDNFGQDGRVVPYLSARTSIPEMWETWNSGTPANGHLPVKNFKPDHRRTGHDRTWKAFRLYRVVAQYIEERASLLNRAPAAVAEDLDSLRRELELKPAIFAKSIVPELQNRIRSAYAHLKSRQKNSMHVWRDDFVLSNTTRAIDMYYTLMCLKSHKYSLV